MTGVAADLSLAARFARRELRGGLTGFLIFLACLTLGVGAIATVRSVSEGLLVGLREDGREILGGDFALRTRGSIPSAAALSALAAAGTVAASVELRTNAATGGAAGPVELKAVDRTYPLYGTLELEGAAEPRADLHALLAPDETGVFGAVAEPGIADRLGIAIGDRLRIGTIEVQLRGLITAEPDRASGGSFSVGPRLMISLPALAASGLGDSATSFVNRVWQVRLPPETGLRAPGAPDPAVAAARAFQAAHPSEGRVRSYRNASPSIEDAIERLTLFLTLVGLTALLVGGVGVSNAVRAYLDGRLITIATLKCIGGHSRVVFLTYLVQTLILAAFGTLIGLGVGATAPLVIQEALQGLLPIEARISVYPGGLLLAGLFGLLVALAFSLVPIGGALATPAAAVFRSTIDPGRAEVGRRSVAAALAAGAALALLVVATSDDRWFAMAFLLGAAVTFGLFYALAALIVSLARRLGRPRRPDLRLALANLHRPGAPTVSVILSLGLGLTVLVAIALIDGNFRRQLESQLPRNAPSFAFFDIQPSQLEEFRAFALSLPGAHDLVDVPHTRARLTRVRDQSPASQLVEGGARWILSGDNDVGYATDLPPQNRVIAGEWWGPEPQPEPLISLVEWYAEPFGVQVGDRMTFSFAGREITGTVANIRDFDRETPTSFSFPVLFAPGALERAPQTRWATLRTDPAAERQILAETVRRFPNVTAVSVRGVLETVGGLLEDLGTAVRVTAAVTLIAGTLVLAGAVAAGHRRRVYDAVVLKVLGATRGDVLRGFLLEYGILGLTTALLAILAGSVIAFVVLTQAFELSGAAFLPVPVLGTAALATCITLAAGFVGTWIALGQRAAPLLRNE